MTRAELDAWADASEIELLVADGFDDAILGIGERFTETEDGAQHQTFVVYDRARMIAILVTRDGMSVEDAEEFFDFNIADAFVGPATPCFVRTGVRDGGEEYAEGEEAGAAGGAGDGGAGDDHGAARVDS